MAEQKIGVSWGGRVHLATSQVVIGNDIHTMCGKIRHEMPLASGDWISVPAKLRCAECEAAIAEAEKPVEVKGQFAALLAEFAQEAAERVGWWGDAVRKAEFAARLYK